MNTFAKKLFLILSSAMFLGCSSSPSPDFYTQDAPLERGFSITLKGRQAVLTSPYWGQGVGVQGTLSSQDPLTIQLETLTFFTNWPQGWTEAVFDLTGSLVLSQGAQGPEGLEVWTVKVLESPEILEPRSGALRYKDSYLTGEKALTALKDRWARIGSAVASQDADLWSEASKSEVQLLPPSWTAHFEGAAGPIFFPEIYGYPEGYSPSESRVQGESLSWDAGYTDSRFPPELKGVRNSGTLYRDWEESLDLWFLRSQWSLFWGQKIEAAVLHTK